MTMALSLKCGDMKWGALCPCPTCQTETTGNRGIEITFSDHFQDWETLEELGKTLKRIRAVCEDEEICHWTFMQFVSQQPHSLVKVTLPATISERVMALLQSLDLPTIDCRPETPKPTDSP